MPLRSDRMPAMAAMRDRGGRLEAAAQKTFVIVAGLPFSRAARVATIHGAMQDQQPRPPAEGRAAHELEDRDDRRADRGEDPQQADGRVDDGRLAALLVDPERELRRDAEGARRRRTRR